MPADARHTTTQHSAAAADQGGGGGDLGPARRPDSEPDLPLPVHQDTGTHATHHSTVLRHSIIVLYLETGRLPGRMKFAGLAGTPKKFVSPGLLKSSISSL